jgi:hypothetical protein
MLLMEDFSGTAKLVGCAISPTTCGTLYGSYVALRDGASDTGGSQIGCLKFATGVELGADQACPAGFDFSWYKQPTVFNGRVPVLKECWRTNGGNANW